jgi:hypothetical protein
MAWRPRPWPLACHSPGVGAGTRSYEPLLLEAARGAENAEKERIDRAIAQRQEIAARITRRIGELNAKDEDG